VARERQDDLGENVDSFVEPDEGVITVDGRSVRDARGHELREIRRRMQMVFQDPYSSLNRE